MRVFITFKKALVQKWSSAARFGFKLALFDIAAKHVNHNTSGFLILDIFSPPTCKKAEMSSQSIYKYLSSGKKMKKNFFYFCPP